MTMSFGIEANDERFKLMRSRAEREKIHFIIRQDRG